MNVAILGLGEVGAAIKQLTEKQHSVFIKELEYDQTKGKKIDVLHVCIPFTQKFETIVVDLIGQLKPQLSIINSTVKPGTTTAIHAQTQANLVHAPIDGVHPHLYEYLFKFTKPLGAVNQTSYQLAKTHFEELGVKTARFNSPFETELAKILSTTYYGWNILFEKWVHQLCQDNAAEFEDVYTRYNQIYNQGYRQELPHVIRPILKHFSGEIGGHCVIPNTKILAEWLDDDFSRFMLEQNQRLAQQSDK